MATLASCVENRKDETSVEAKCPVRRLDRIQMRATVALIGWWLWGWGGEAELGLAGELDVEMKEKEKFGKITVAHFF